MLADEMRYAELYLKEATVIYGFLPFAARLPELAIELKLEDYTAPTCSIPAQDYWSSERSCEIVEVHFAEMTGAVATNQASVTKLRASVV